MTVGRAITVWVLTRAIVVLWLCTSEHGVIGDVAYYRDSLEGLSELGVSGALVEYPVPAVVVLWIPYAALEWVGAIDLYPGLVAALALVTDLAFFGVLLRARRWTEVHSRPAWFGIPAAEWAWLLAIPALGATAYARFDLVPGILVGLAVLYLVHRPAVAAGFGALATGVKYWPAIVLPGIAAPRKSRRRVIATVAACGGILVLASIALGGWDRLFTPLDYQDERGLQVESIAATPAMLVWGFSEGGGEYATHYAPYKAYEVTGPMVEPLLRLTTWATVVVAITLILLWLLAWLRIRTAAQGVDALVWLVLASVGGFVVTSKVLSPQYLLWLLPAAAAGLVVVRSTAAWWRLVVWTGIAVLATVLTHLIFPRAYGAVIVHGDGSAGVVLLLLGRNLLLLALVGYAFGQAAVLLLRSRVPSRRVPTRALVED